MLSKIDNIIKKINRDKIFNIYIILLISSILLFSRNTMITTCIIGFERSMYISMILFVPLYINVVKKALKRQLIFKEMIGITIMLIAIALVVIIKKDIQLYNFSILYYVISATVLILTVDIKKIQKCYINIMLIISIYSLITTYLIKPLIFKLGLDNVITNTSFIITNSIEYKFLNLGLSFAFFDKTYDRNYGIFTEPSFFQFYLIIAIIVVLFSENKRKTNWIKMGIFVLTVYTTKSAAGFVVLIFIILTYMLKFLLENIRDKKKIFRMLMGGVFILIFLLCIPSIQNSMNFVYEKITSSNASSTSRLGSLEYTVTKFLNSPIIGNKISDILLYENDLTNTIFTIGAIYGLIPFLCVIYFILKFATTFKQNKLITLCIFITVMLTSNSHLFIGIQSFWMIILLGLREDNDENTLDS